jgi:uncharacterized protein
VRRAFLDARAGVRNGWKILLFLALWVPLERVTLAFLGNRGMSAWLFSETVLALLCAGLSGLFLVVEERPASSLGLRFDAAWGRAFLLGALGGGGLILAAALLARGAGGFHWVRQGEALGLLPWFWLFLAVAFREELLFRGYVLQRAVEGLGPGPALVLLACAFSGWHAGNPGMAGTTLCIASANILLAGLLLGLAYLRTGSLALPIGIHLGWNWVQGPLLGFGVSGLESQGVWRPVLHGRPDWLTGGAFGLEAGLPCTVVCLCACGGLLLWNGRRRPFRAVP